ncbi:hypothetical protein DFJ73DRAFT_803690 [Zopfochytrium polystomum]|nr:hypothetical protein DFJ73DRAFT_803690 [Zopfochytrium polystomum]
MLMVLLTDADRVRKLVAGLKVNENLNSSAVFQSVDRKAAAAVQPAPRCTLPTVKIFFALVVLLVATLFLAVDTSHQARVIALPVRAHNEAPPAPPALQRRGFFKKMANKAKNAANKAYDKAQAAQNKLGPAGKIAAMVARQTPVGRAYYAGKALAKTGMAISRGIARHESAKDIFNSAKGEMMEGALNVVPGGRQLRMATKAAKAMKGAKSLRNASKYVKKAKKAYKQYEKLSNKYDEVSDKIQQGQDLYNSVAEQG